MTQALNFFMHPPRTVIGSGAELPPGATGAWGTRKMFAAYGGQCLRIRRSSDQAEQDIGFSGQALDTSALLSFTGAAHGFVATLYDQTGNGRSLSQSTAANQPQLVASGAVITSIGGQPSLDFNGSSHYLESAVAMSNFLTAAAGTIAVVFSLDTFTTSVGSPFPYNDSAIWADSAGFLGSHTDGNAQVINAYAWDGNFSMVSRAALVATSYIHLWWHQSPTLKNYRNGVAVASVGPTNNITDLTGALRIARQYTTKYHDGQWAEAMTYNTALMDEAVSDIGTICAGVYGLTWP